MNFPSSWLPHRFCVAPGEHNFATKQRMAKQYHTHTHTHKSPTNTGIYEVNITNSASATNREQQKETYKRASAIIGRPHCRPRSRQSLFPSHRGHVESHDPVLPPGAFVFDQSEPPGVAGTSRARSTSTAHTKDNQTNATRNMFGTGSLGFALRAFLR